MDNNYTPEQPSNNQQPDNNQEPVNEYQAEYQQQAQNNAYQQQATNYQQPGGMGQQAAPEPNYNYNTNYNTNFEAPSDPPLSVGEWILTMLALAIPCVGVVLYFVWAFGQNGNINRRNYCRAGLIMMGAVIVLYIIIFMIFGGAMMGSMRSYY